MDMSDEGHEQYAALIGGVVEGKPLDTVIDEAGPGSQSLLDQAVADQSADMARQYAKEQIREKYGVVCRDEDDNLYLVKKVFCSPHQYEAMADAIDAADTDKFNVVTGISAEPALIGYQGDEPGIEYRLAAAETPEEAFRATEDIDPHLYSYNRPFNDDMAEQIDNHATQAFYHHRPEDIEQFFTEATL